MLVTIFLIVVAASVFSAIALLPANSCILMLLGSFFMIAHWWLLGGLVESLARNQSLQTMIWGMLSVFPAAAALAVLFVAIRSNRIHLLPALFGVLSVPAAVTLVCFVNGIAGLCSVTVTEGSFHG